MRRRGAAARAEGAGRSAAWVAVGGARPNLVKLAPLVRAAEAAGRRLLWLHTGQQQRPELAALLAAEVGLPPPAWQGRHVPPGRGRIGAIARALAAPLGALRPALVVVVGDVDSTLAGALAARRLGLPLAHVEAGLRCGDRSMPEERNRVRVDALSGLLHVSEPGAVGLLRAEGVAPARIHRAGNVVADQLAWARPRLESLPRRLGGARRRGAYGVVTLHRPANVDDPARLARWAAALIEAARDLPLLFPVHPRTARGLGATLRRRLARGGVTLLPPLTYLPFLGAVARAACVLTDSGGLPVEASLLGVPCLTLRPRYEHRLTLTHGTNVLAGGDPRRLPAALRALLARPRRPSGAPPRDWDGRAAERIVERWTHGSLPLV